MNGYSLREGCRVGQEADSKNSRPQMVLRPRKARLEDAHNPVAPLPPRGSARTLTLSVPKILPFSMPIDK